MGYANNKMYKKAHVQKMVNKVTSDQRFIEYQKKWKEEAKLEAFDSFLLIGADYLFRTMKYGKDGILEFFDFVVKQLNYANQDEKYFPLLNEELADDIGLNILENRTVEREAAENCEVTEEQKAIRDRAMELRKMTNEELVAYIEAEKEKSWNLGHASGYGKGHVQAIYEFLEGMNITGLGKATKAKLWKDAGERGFLAEERSSNP